jgi:hypothetical protein
MTTHNIVFTRCLSAKGEELLAALSLTATQEPMPISLEAHGGRGGRPSPETESVDLAFQFGTNPVHFAVKIDFAIIPCTPFFPSTNCVIEKSAAMLVSI